ncbi:flagellin [Rhizobium laguerreae]|uniref:flagellin n=1 Tax=Rhizobium TaxID=379 RepID=UPI0035E45022
MEDRLGGCRNQGLKVDQDRVAAKIVNASVIGRLVDADMEEESSRLAAFQTQQQLAVQSLSIANRAPQNILSLFQP